MFLWEDAPVPADLRPGQEVIRLRWKKHDESHRGPRHL